MKPMPHEQKRLQQYATLTFSLSLDTRPAVTKKSISEFTQDVANMLRQKRQVKRWVLALVELDKEGK
jgi:hypothetical protein